jgi:hypothetical protein
MSLRSFLSKNRAKIEKAAKGKSAKALQEMYRGKERSEGYFIVSKYKVSVRFSVLICRSLLLEDSKKIIMMIKLEFFPVVLKWLMSILEVLPFIFFLFFSYCIFGISQGCLI